MMNWRLHVASGVDPTVQPHGGMVGEPSQFAFRGRPPDASCTHPRPVGERPPSPEVLCRTTQPHKTRSPRHHRQLLHDIEAPGKPHHFLFHSTPSTDDPSTDRHSDLSLRGSPVELHNAHSKEEYTLRLPAPEMHGLSVFPHDYDTRDTYDDNDNDEAHEGRVLSSTSRNNRQGMSTRASETRTRQSTIERENLRTLPRKPTDHNDDDKRRLYGTNKGRTQLNDIDNLGDPLRLYHDELGDHFYDTGASQRRTVTPRQLRRSETQSKPHAPLVERPTVAPQDAMTFYDDDDDRGRIAIRLPEEYTTGTYDDDRLAAEDYGGGAEEDNEIYHDFPDERDGENEEDIADDDDQLDADDDDDEDYNDDLEGDEWTHFGEIDDTETRPARHAIGPSGFTFRDNIHTLIIENCDDFPIAQRLYEPCRNAESNRRWTKPTAPSRLTRTSPANPRPQSLARDTTEQLTLRNRRLARVRKDDHLTANISRRDARWAFDEYCFQERAEQHESAESLRLRLDQGAEAQNTQMTMYIRSTEQRQPHDDSNTPTSEDKVWQNGRVQSYEEASGLPADSISEIGSPSYDDMMTPYSTHLTRRTVNAYNAPSSEKVEDPPSPMIWEDLPVSDTSSARFHTPWEEATEKSDTILLTPKSDRMSPWEDVASETSSRRFFSPVDFDSDAQTEAGAASQLLPAHVGDDPVPLPEPPLEQETNLLQPPQPLAHAELPLDGQQPTTTTRLRKPRLFARELKLSTINVQGFRDTRYGDACFTALVNVLAHHNVHVCVLTETRMKAEYNCTVTDSHGSLWRIMLHDSKGAAGVGVACRENLVYASNGSWRGDWRLEELEVLSDRILRFDLANRDHSFHVVGAYGPATSDTEASEGFFHTLAATIPDDRAVLLLGDLNAHIRYRDNADNLTKCTTHAGQRLLTLMEAKHLRNAIHLFRQQKDRHLYTWRGEGAMMQRRSTLDYVLLNHLVTRRDLINASVTRTRLETDHRMVHLVLRGCTTNHGQRYHRRVVHRQRRSRTHLDPRKQPQFTRTCELDTEWFGLQAKYLERQHPRNRYNLNPYVRPSTHELVRQRQEMAKVKRSSPSPTNLEKFRQARTAARKAIQADRENWIASTAKRTTELFEAGDIHGAYQLLRPLYKSKRKPISIPSLDHLRDEIQKLLHTLPTPSTTIEPIWPTSTYTFNEISHADALNLAPPLDIYTDGSAAKREGRWEAGFGIVWGDTPTTSHGGPVPEECTSDRAEIFAAAAALAMFRAPRVNIYTDSAYLITSQNHFESILASGGDGHLNGDLLWFIAQQCLIAGRTVTFLKVKAHSNVLRNELADQAAKRGKGSAPTPRDNQLRQIIFSHPRVQVRLPVRDGAPDDDEIADAAIKLSNLRAPGYDRIHAETIKLGALLAKYPKAEEKLTEEDRKDIQFFRELSHLIRRCWQLHQVPAAWTIAPITLIPKPGQPGKHRGIAVLSVFWKLISRIIADRLEAIPLHRIQHGFRRRTGVVEAIATHRLYIQGARLQNVQLLACYVDITRAYDSIDRGRMLNLLQNLGVGNNILGLLRHSFENEQAVLRLAGAYSEVFQTSRGVKQGDVASPVLFNIVMDCIIQEFLQRANQCIPEIKCGDTNLPLLPLFYADDGVFFATNSNDLQMQLDIFSRLCAGFELEINVSKTNVCAYAHPFSHVNISIETNIRKYHQRHALLHPTVDCAFCGNVIAADDLPDHWKTEGCVRFQREKNYVMHAGALLQRQADLIAFLDDHPDDRNAPPISHYAPVRIPLNGIACPLVPRDAHGRALVFAASARTRDIECPFGCATVSPSRAALVAHTVAVHSEHVLILPRLKFCQNIEPQMCPICAAVFDNDAKLRLHHGCASCADRSSRFRLQLDLDKQKTDKGAIRLRDTEIEYVPEFRYLGRIFCEKDSDMTTFFKSIRAAKLRWHQLGRLLRQRTLRGWCKRTLIAVIVHSALLFSSESWTLDQRKLNLLQSLQQRILRTTFSIYGRMTADGFRYPSRETVLKTAKMADISDIVKGRRLGFYTRTLARDDKYLILKQWIEAFETAGAETPQRYDGRRAWWTRQMREARVAKGIPFKVICVSHWVKKAKGEDEEEPS